VLGHPSVDQLANPARTCNAAWHSRTRSTALPRTCAHAAWQALDTRKQFLDSTDGGNVCWARPLAKIVWVGAPKRHPNADNRSRGLVSSEDWHIHCVHLRYVFGGGDAAGLGSEAVQRQVSNATIGHLRATTYRQTWLNCPNLARLSPQQGTTQVPTPLVSSPLQINPLFATFHCILFQVLAWGTDFVHVSWRCRCAAPWSAPSYAAAH
jgi:hypothetical protein